jgi:hypothetical protein
MSRQTKTPVMPSDDNSYNRVTSPHFVTISNNWLQSEPETEVFKPANQLLITHD